jgi:hypothetical protein
MAESMAPPSRDLTERRTVAGLFSDQASDEQVIDALKAGGFTGDQIGVAMRGDVRHPWSRAYLGHAHVRVMVPAGPLRVSIGDGRPIRKAYADRRPRHRNQAGHRARPHTEAYQADPQHVVQELNRLRATESTSFLPSTQHA